MLADTAPTSIHASMSSIQDGDDIRHYSGSTTWSAVLAQHARHHAVSGLSFRLFVCFEQARMLFAGHSAFRAHKTNGKRGQRKEA